MHFGFDIIIDCSYEQTIFSKSLLILYLTTTEYFQYLEYFVNML